MQQLYKIYFDGEIAPNFNSVEVKKRAQSVFKLSEKKIDQLFNGSKHTLKDGLSSEECQRYLKQLLNIGLIGKSELSAEKISQPTDITTEVLPLNSDADRSIQSTSTTTKSKKLPVISLVVLVFGGVAYAWQAGYIKIPLENNNQPVAVQPDKTTPTNVPPVANISPISTVDNNSVIEECTNTEVTNLLEKVLAQGIPQLIQRSSPDVNLTIQDYIDNQELYFDSIRNKRLCGVIAQFSIDAPNIPQNLENPSVVYEVIYEIQKEDDQAIRLSTFRQKIISSNLQSTTDT